MGESVYASHHMIFVLALSWPLMQLKQILGCGYMLLIAQVQRNCFFLLIQMCIILAHDVYAVISPLSSLTTKYLHLNQLLIDLAGDPSLALIPVSIRPQVLQTLFIASGCDYISFSLVLARLLY